MTIDKYDVRLPTGFSAAEQSRRDDLEALGYMLLYMVSGSLPWTKHIGDESVEERYEKMKNVITVKELCDGLPGSYTIYKYIQ